MVKINPADRRDVARVAEIHQTARSHYYERRAGTLLHEWFVDRLRSSVSAQAGTLYVWWLNERAITFYMRRGDTTDMSRQWVEIVRSGYDAMAERHLAWISQIEGDPRLRFLQELDQTLPENSSVLDLGCGQGVPCTRELARRHEVVGIDLSEAQLRIARDLVPRAHFEQADLTSLSWQHDSLDAITAFYSLGHVPRDLLPELFARFKSWLRPGGWLLATLSALGQPDGLQADFLGVPMFFSGYDADTNRRLLRDAGFDIVIDEVVAMREPEGETMFLWVLARRPD